MHHDDLQTDELKTKFWKALADSPFVFLERQEAPNEAVVMTAQLDRDADSEIWFFTTRDNSLAKMGSAVLTFAAKDHQIFAKVEGTLSEETSQARLDKQWNQIVEAWFPRGKNDPNLLMLSMKLGNAEIWDSDLGLVNNVKMIMGMDVRQEGEARHVETTL